MSSAFVEFVPPAVLLVFLAVAGYQDLKTREVPDWIWLLMGGAGLITLVAGTWGASRLSLGLDAVGGLFALEHVIPWDQAVKEREWVIGLVEATIYLGVIALAVFAYFTYPSATPPAFLAIVISVVIARVLFESKLLYGGADAKALMISAIVVPFWPRPLLAPYPGTIAMTVLPYVPFAFSMLVDGALLTLAIPVGILIYNLRQGVRSFPEMFTLYEIPTAELPKRFVWLRKPRMDADEDVDTSEEDQDLRKEQAQVLEEQGVKTVWVTPQLPMVVALAVGAVIALLLGNLLLWIL